MKMNAIKLTTACVILTLFSCQEDIEQVELRFPNVDPELWSFYTAFENEARARGLEYDLAALQISGEIQEIPAENVAGSCRFGNHIHNEVTIDQSFWNRSSTLLKEFVVFHELGHCVLLRDHDESTDARGRCLSIMRSGLTECRDSYTLQSRDYYLDELFFQL